VHGYCSLGVSVEATLAAIDNADHVIAQVNKHMPRTFGDGIIHVSEIDAFVEVDVAPSCILRFRSPRLIETKIGDYMSPN
jgi:acyl-CoA hydrolase